MVERKAGKGVDTYASIAVEDVDVIAGVEIIDRTFAIDLKSVCWGRSIERPNGKGRD